MKTTISIDIKTKKRLKKYGKFHDSWDKIVNKLLDIVEKKR